MQFLFIICVEEEVNVHFFFLLKQSQVIKTFEKEIERERLRLSEREIEIKREGERERGRER